MRLTPGERLVARYRESVELESRPVAAKLKPTTKANALRDVPEAPRDRLSGSTAVHRRSMAEAG